MSIACWRVWGGVRGMSCDETGRQVLVDAAKLAIKLKVTAV